MEKIIPHPPKAEYRALFMSSRDEKPVVAQPGIFTATRAVAVARLLDLRQKVAGPWLEYRPNPNASWQRVEVK